MSTAGKGAPYIFWVQAWIRKQRGKKGLISGFPLELIDEGLQVPLRPEHFAVEFVAPGGKAEWTIRSALSGP